jgi:thioredoxin reductase (NADPH)
MTNLTRHPRYDQMFPILEPRDIERLKRFGSSTAYCAGTRIVTSGCHAPGFVVLLSGKLEVSQETALNRREVIVTYGAGQFTGELAQLSDRPALVDLDVLEDATVIIITADRLRDVLVQEAALGERIMRALILRRANLLEISAGGPIIIGRSEAADVLRLQGFLRRNVQPHRVIDPDRDPDAAALIERFDIDVHHLPIVLCANGKLLRNPGEKELARCMGLSRRLDETKTFDIAIVGSGPAGLAAAVYSSSEGLSTIVLDCRAFGGQAGASARIENYLGFPTGISGLALMARAYNQAQKFGTELALPEEVFRLEKDLGNACYKLVLGDGESVRARTVVIASGARYRRLELDNVSRFEGASVHYWASPIEARLCEDQEVALVGAGNSAGQATVYLASQARKVWLLVRGASLASSMSNYLVERIKAQPNIEVLLRTEVTELEGAEDLTAVSWRDIETGTATRRNIRHLFLLVGAEPNTDWLAGCGIALDEKGFVRTGVCDRSHPLETNLPGTFAIGDVRAGSIKRVAAAVGEGAQVVAAIHEFLAE